MRNYDYVNTRMGSDNTRRFSHGNVQPITAVPHGMASFTVQNEKSREPWFYSPYSRSFEGIRLTHQPSPWMGEYGSLIITGQRGDCQTTADERWSSFDNRGFISQPAYMRGEVFRDRYTFELAPTNSGAVVRFTFADGENSVLLLGDACTEFTQEGDYIVGFTTQATQKMPRGELKEYFAVRLDVPFRMHKVENGAALRVEGRSVNVYFATSFVSSEQAKENDRRELAGRTLEEVRANAEALWNRRLDRIEIEDGDGQKKATFYSCLYRAFLWPRRFYEIDAAGKKVHRNLHSGEIVEGVMYADNGFWDTYRTLFPLYSLLDTDLYAEMCEGFYNYYLDSGWLPKWLSPANVCCMPGMLIEAVMADAIVKDIVRGEAAEKILQALLKDGEDWSDTHGYGRTGAQAYRKYGYVPYTVAKESVNETLDCCYGDYCIAQAAEKLGHAEIAARYRDYAKNYRKLFDAQTGFMRGRDENGRFRDAPFDSYAWGGDYTEGSAWQNSFAVYHDVAGLNELYGGKLSEKIDQLMTAPPLYTVGSYRAEIHEMSEMAAQGSQCAISNQPSFHIPFLYAELGDVAKTAAAVQKFAAWFNPSPQGFPGDEDNGAMASWYVFACLGMYPMCPSRPDFTMSLPLLDKIKVHLANDRVLTVERDRMQADGMRNKVAYADIMRGGDLADIVRKEKGEKK